MEPQKEMTQEDVEQFFSATAEFKVESHDQGIKITYEDNYKVISTIIYRPTIQTLIRKIKELVWNHCNNIFD
jgi:hypothetical protein